MDYDEVATALYNTLDEFMEYSECDEDILQRFIEQTLQKL